MKYYKSLKEVDIEPKDKKYCYIYLFRHAQTTFNKAHRFTGWKDAQLTPFGIKQAKKVAKELKNKKIDFAVRTSLSRSKDTLNEVLKFHPECKHILTDDRMRERSYGDLEGHHHSWFIEREGKDSYKTLLHWHKVDHLDGRAEDEFIDSLGKAELKLIRRSYKVRPPGGESIRDVEKRVKPFLKELLKFVKKYKVNVAISAHGNSMRPFRKHFEKFSKVKMVTLENPFDKAFIYKVKVR